MQLKSGYDRNSVTDIAHGDLYHCISSFLMPACVHIVQYKERFWFENAFCGYVGDKSIKTSSTASHTMTNDISLAYILMSIIKFFSSLMETSGLLSGYTAYKKNIKEMMGPDNFNMPWLHNIEIDKADFVF